MRAEIVLCAEMAVFVLNLSDTIFLRTAPHIDANLSLNRAFSNAVSFYVAEAVFLQDKVLVVSFDNNAKVLAEQELDRRMIRVDRELKNDQKQTLSAVESRSTHGEHDADVNETVLSLRKQQRI